MLFSCAVLAYLGFELFFRRTRCGVPTRQDKPCRLNTRGRWRSCHHDSHRRLKRAALIRALRGGAPERLQERPEDRPVLVPGEGTPLDDPFVTSSWLVRAVVVVAVLNVLLILLCTPWDVPVAPE